MGSTRPATRIESRFRVTTDYPDLGLHSAAVTGNVGLAYYALTHGQPENSVLHGLLPLHAACSGGSEQIVNMLLERGADVNAPRLPRRYSNDAKNAPSVGVSGSAPLHFAAANGHLPIVKLLLLKGAIHDKQDKHGLTPEDLALANEHEEVVQVLRAWATLRASLAQRDGLVEEDEEEQVQDAEEGLASVAPLKTRAGMVGVGRKKSIKRSLDNFVHRSRRPSASSIRTEFSTLSGSDASITARGKRPQLTIQPNAAYTDDDSALSTTAPSPTASVESNQRRLATDPVSPPVVLSHLGGSSPKQRRPSLPAILERASHAIVHPRSHRDSHASSSTTSPLPSGLTRSATRTTFDSDSGSISSSRRFTSNKTLRKLFARGPLSARSVDNGSSSPASASPSPPSSLAPLPFDDEDVDRTIEAIRRQSFDGHLPHSQRSSLELPGSRTDFSRIRSVSAGYETSPSAPATRTTFLEGAIQPTRAVSAGSFSPSVLDLTEDRSSFYRQRKGSEVSSPSPLALEWTRNSTRPKSHVYGRADDERARLDGFGIGIETQSHYPADWSDDEFSDAHSQQAYHDRSWYSPSSPSSSYRQSHLAPGPATPWSTQVGRYSTANTAMSSTDRPASVASSGASSLRKVASANLRRGATGEGTSLRYETDPYYSPVASAQRSSAEDTADSDDAWQSNSRLYGPPKRRSTTDERMFNRRSFSGGNLLASATTRASRSRGASFTSTNASTVSVSPQAASPAVTPLSTSQEWDREEEESIDQDPVLAPRIMVSVTSPRQGRSRNVSVSSVISTNGTSPSPVSLLSSGALSTSSSGVTAFPAVPEYPSLKLQGTLEPLHGMKSTIQRRVSTRAEARDLVRQAERDILSLGASGSTASLSAQLAAYGERLALERALARGEVDAAQEQEQEAEESTSTPSFTGRGSSEFESSQSMREMAYQQKRDEHGGGEAAREELLRPVLPAHERRDESRDSTRSGKSSTRSVITIEANSMANGRDSKPSSTSAAKIAPVHALTPSILDQPLSEKSEKALSTKSFQKHVHERNESGNPGKARFAPVPLINVQSASSPTSKALSDVAKIYAARSEALRKKGIAITSAVSVSPLVSPASSPSSRKSSANNGSGLGADQQMWIISGHHAPGSHNSPIHASVRSRTLPESADSKSIRSTASVSASASINGGGGKNSSRRGSADLLPKLPPPATGGAASPSSTSRLAATPARLVHPPNITASATSITLAPADLATFRIPRVPSPHSRGGSGLSSPHLATPMGKPASLEVVRASLEPGSGPIAAPSYFSSSGRDEPAREEPALLAVPSEHPSKRKGWGKIFHKSRS